MLILLVLACFTDEPVVSVVPDPDRVAAAREKRETEELRSSPQQIEAGYQKADGVWVDVRFLGGRSYTLVREHVARQLGALLEETTLPGDGGRELRFERATLRLAGDKIDMIDMIDVPLPEPVRRSEALRITGFPDQVPRNWIALSGEFRLTNAFEFRRILFKRSAPGSEDIVSVQAWKTPPGASRE